MLISWQQLKAQKLGKNELPAAFYKHIMNRISYPTKAVEAKLQGNSLVLFTILEGGKLQNIQINTELGMSSDVSVVNALLSYPNFKSIKAGKYAFTTWFRINECTSPIINENIKVPQGYITLEKFVITSVNIMCGPYQSRVNSTPKIIEPSDEPMFILNGKVLSNFEQRRINPNQINDISILKDGSSVSQYGEEAKNGVIIINTKNEGDAVVTDSSDKGIKLRASSNSTNEPIYIVDKQMVTNIHQLSPDSIENMTILKNVAAMSLYGDIAKNGAIIITTKKETQTKK